MQNNEEHNINYEYISIKDSDVFKNINEIKPACCGYYNKDGIKQALMKGSVL